MDSIALPRVSMCRIGRTVIAGVALSIPSIAVCALETKQPYAECLLGDDCGEDGDCDVELSEPEGLFFQHQCQFAVEHLVEVQHCDVESITYAGVFHGKHVWMGRSLS